MTQNKAQVKIILSGQNNFQASVHLFFRVQQVKKLHDRQEIS